jgi:hypothetical protein
VNDTARELGGTLGVAVIGSVFASIYASGLADELSDGPIPADEIAIAQSSVGAGLAVAERMAESAGPEMGAAVRTAVHESFLGGFHAGSWVSAAVVLTGALLALRYLPARPSIDLADDEVRIDGNEHRALLGSFEGVDASDAARAHGNSRTALQGRHVSTPATMRTACTFRQRWVRGGCRTCGGATR